MVYKIKENIFDDTECTVQDVSKAMPVVIPYDQITRVMMIQDFKSDQIFLQLKVKGAGSIMIPVDHEDMEGAKNICAFVHVCHRGGSPLLDRVWLLCEQKKMKKKPLELAFQGRQKNDNIKREYKFFCANFTIKRRKRKQWRKEKKQTVSGVFTESTNNRTAPGRLLKDEDTGRRKKRKRQKPPLIHTLRPRSSA